MIAVIQLHAQFQETAVIDQIAQFDQDRNVVFFDIGLSLQEEQLLDSLQIMNKPPFRLYGNPSDTQVDIAEYLQSLGNDVTVASQGASIIHALIMHVHQMYRSQPIAVIMRATKTNDKFDIPRWHYDGVHDPILEDIQTKFVCALQGPGTLFAQVSQAGRKNYIDFCDQQPPVTLQEKYQRNFDLYVRTQVATIIDQYPRKQTATRQGVVFAIGDPLTAAFHSEPAINRDRLFLAIIPGTDEQIAFLQKVETGK